MLYFSNFTLYNFQENFYVKCKQFEKQNNNSHLLFITTTVIIIITITKIWVRTAVCRKVSPLFIILIIFIISLLISFSLKILCPLILFDKTISPLFYFLQKYVNRFCRSMISIFSKNEIFIFKICSEKDLLAPQFYTEKVSAPNFSKKNSSPPVAAPCPCTP